LSLVEIRGWMLVNADIPDPPSGESMSKTKKVKRRLSQRSMLSYNVTGGSRQYACCEREPIKRHEWTISSGETEEICGTTYSPLAELNSGRLIFQTTNAQITPHENGYKTPREEADTIEFSKIVNLDCGEIDRERSSGEMTSCCSDLRNDR